MVHLVSKIIKLKSTYERLLHESMNVLIFLVTKNVYENGEIGCVKKVNFYKNFRLIDLKFTLNYLIFTVSFLYSVV